MRWLVLVALVACGKSSSDKPPPPPAPAKKKTCTEPHVCVGDTVVECDTNAPVQECKDGCASGACKDPCAAQGVELVYVVDTDLVLRSFDPHALPGGDPFHVVGKLACEPTSHPFSMAVDRTGIAWVVYDDGKLFRVSILDGHCTPAGANDHGPHTFGMGYAANGSASETLYLAANDESRALGRFDPAKLEWTVIGPLDVPTQKASPELTGTGDGKLFGYFPEPSPGFVQEIDRDTGKLVGAHMKLQGTPGEHQAWAFAHWGGVFYVFTTIDGNSAVYAVKRKTGAFSVLMNQLPFQIVGAGVSTCAPELERQ